MPFRAYLDMPTHTFYLRCSESSLHERLASKQDLKDDDTALLRTPGRLARLLNTYESVANADPTAVFLDTDDKAPDALADRIIDHLVEASDAQAHRR
ncbi:hypothetical protein [Streptomyces sp. UG1]|uniref:hypothetical protein n=1 Tax=Streptomyces sp. UG1 TaxID=3417652 RepID=UPI003CFA4BA6